MGAIFSKLMGGLTNPGVQAPPTPNGSNGPTTFYPNQPAAALALASASRATAAPGVSSVDGTIGPDGTENETVSNTPPPDNPQPKLVQPSWSDAQASSPGNPLGNKELSTKGKALTLLLQTGLGAIAGDAAGRTGSPRYGYPGASAGGVAGMRIPFQIAEEANLLKGQQLDQARIAAQTAAAVPMAQANLAKTQAETANYAAQSARRGYFTIPGVGLVSPDDSQPNGYRLVVGEPAKKDLADTDSRQAFLQSVDPDGKIFSAKERAVFAANGTFPKETAERNPTEWGLRLDAQSSDPAVSGPATKALAAAQQSQIAFHKAIQKQNDPSAGMTAAQKRTLASNPDWTSGQEELKGANESLAKSYAYAETYSKVDPESDPQVQADRKHVAAVMARMEAAKQKALGGTAQTQPSAQPQTFTHGSSDGKWLWNGQQWVATGK